MAGQVFGLDFGTTNSLLSVIGRDGRPIHLTDNTDRPHPSVVWYRGSEVVVGRKARENLDAGAEPISGSFVRSPKRLLDADAPIHVAGRDIDPRDIIAEVLRFLVADATTAHPVRHEVKRVVMTIPVRLDGAGRRRLRDAARKAQIGIVQFVHEPLAALYAFLRSQTDYRHRLAELDGCRILVFDWGGGTLDLTLSQVLRNQIVQMANVGDDELGGDRFDELIRNQVRESHARQHGIEDLAGLERDEARIVLLNQCELRKIELSHRKTATVFVRDYLRREGSGRDLSVSITASDVTEWTRELVDRGLGAIDSLLEQNHLSHQQIALCLPTGGMINMPAIRDGLHERFGARSPSLQNADRIISEGAAWIAHDDLRLALAKPIELLQSDDTYAPVVPLPFLLPVENQTIPAASAVYRCVDPRSGRASFTFARPRRIRARDARSDRQVYATFQLDVDETAPPLMERLELNLTIDHDYVAHVELYSTMRQHRLKAEIVDLEFTVAFPSGTSPKTGSAQNDREEDSPPIAHGPAVSTAQAGRVQLRSNISASESWQNVPGDLVLQYQPSWFDERTRAYSNWQKEEWTYYKDCPYCHRSRYQYWRDECTAERCLWRLIYPVKSDLPQEQSARVLVPEVDHQPSAEPTAAEDGSGEVPTNDALGPASAAVPEIDNRPSADGTAAEDGSSRAAIDGQLERTGADAKSIGAESELKPDEDIAAAPVVAPIADSPLNGRSQEGHQVDQVEEQQLPRAPRQYRVTPRAPPPSRRSSVGAPQPQETGELRGNDRALPLDVRLMYEKAGLCRISLLPRRTADFPEDLEVTTSDARYAFVMLQDEWYQDVTPDHLGVLLQNEIEWDAQLPGGRHVRWSLAGRPIYVLCHNDKLSGFVATQRLSIGEEHVVLCLNERLEEVEEAINLTGSPAAIELDESNGLPHGWRGLRGVIPRKHVAPSPHGSIPDSLRPLADVEILFQGGIRIDRQAWLHGYPPHIRLRGDTSSVGNLLIDGSPASLTTGGHYEVEGWDLPGEHTVWCSSASRSYLIRDGVETWKPWKAYMWSVGTFAGEKEGARTSICGALVQVVGPENSVRRATVVPASNNVILGANPGEIEVCQIRRDLRATRCVGFPWFDPVWALPADPLRCSKKIQRVLLIGDPRPVSSSLDRHGAGQPQTPHVLNRVRRWCSAIRMAGRKGLRTEPDASAIVALWGDYKRQARMISRRSR